MNFKQHHTSDPRQQAMEMLSNVDIMLYLGGENSSCEIKFKFEPDNRDYEVR